MTNPNIPTDSQNKPASSAEDPGMVREEAKVVNDPAVGRAVDQQVSRLWEAVSYDHRVRLHGASGQYVARADSASSLSSSNASLEITGLSSGRPVAAMGQHQTGYNLHGTNARSTDRNVGFGIPTGDGGYKYVRFLNDLDLERGYRRQISEDITVRPDGTITALRTEELESDKGYIYSTKNIAPQEIAGVVGSMASNIASALEQYDPVTNAPGQYW